MTYIVVHAVKSACGMHPSVAWRPCKACARAAAITESALATTKPKKPAKSINNGGSHGQRMFVEPPASRAHRRAAPPLRGEGKTGI